MIADCLTAIGLLMIFAVSAWLIVRLVQVQRQSARRRHPSQGGRQ